MVVTFAEPAMNAAKEVIAVIGADMSLAAVAETVKQIKPTPASYAFIIDKSGLVVNHPNIAHELKQVTDIEAALSVSSIAALAKNESGGEVRIQGIPGFLYARNIGGTDWYLVLVVDENEVTAPIQTLVNVSALTALLVVLFSIVILVFAISWVTNRLIVIRHASESVKLSSAEIAAGNMDLYGTYRTPGQLIGADQFCYGRTDVDGQTKRRQCASSQYIGDLCVECGHAGRRDCRLGY